VDTKDKIERAADWTGLLSSLVGVAAAAVICGVKAARLLEKWSPKDEA